MKINVTTHTVPRGIALLVAVALAFIILFASLTHVVANPSAYRHITNPQQQEQNEQILTYLRGPLFSANTLSFLTPAEQAHMTDVKELFDGLFILHLICVGILVGVLVVFALQRMWEALDETLGRALWWGGWGVLVLCALVALFATIGFTGFWSVFHEIFFPQGNWQFPQDSTLITLYPETFFASFVTRMLLYAGAMGACAVLLGMFLSRMRRAQAEFVAKTEGKAEKPRRRHRRR